MYKEIYIKLYFMFVLNKLKKENSYVRGKI
jgi:hypothetical protein